MSLSSGRARPAWSCQPPPVVRSCSTAEHAVIEIELIPAQTARAIYRPEESGPENRGRPESRAFGHRAEKRNFQSAAKVLELGPERSKGVA